MLRLERAREEEEGEEGEEGEEEEELTKVTECITASESSHFYFCAFWFLFLKIWATNLQEYFCIVRKTK